jgi:hypothetical protein
MTRARYIAALFTSVVLPACNDGGDGGKSQPSAGTGGGGAAGSSVVPIAGSPCAELCDIIEALSCPADNPDACIASCNQYWEREPCNEERRVFLNCSAQQPQSSWECNADSGEAEPKAGLCDGEKAAVDACLAAST